MTDWTNPYEHLGPPAVTQCGHREDDSCFECNGGAAEEAEDRRARRMARTRPSRRALLRSLDAWARGPAAAWADREVGPMPGVLDGIHVATDAAFEAGLIGIDGELITPAPSTQPAPARGDAA